ncbi:MAG TPA: exodeoxyribonuclease VII large subunit, partial [Ferruginibacter sp.]|nr:exodeoxyribonuclease VII large subunit [Ferruginibacter sp.]
MSDIQPIKLSELTGQIAKVISSNFGHRTYWVIAEITNLKFYPAKNYYFLDLVEKDVFSNTVLTSIKANAWSTATQNIKRFEKQTGQAFDNNIKVLLQVSVEYHIT